MWPKRLLGHIYVQNQRVDLCFIQKKGAMQSCHNHDQDNFGVLFQDFFLVTLEAGFHILLNPTENSCAEVKAAFNMIKANVAKSKINTQKKISPKWNRAQNLLIITLMPSELS